MKFSRLFVHRKTRALPELRFEQSQLTSFSGLVVMQQLFAQLELKRRLRGCFRPPQGNTNLRLREHHVAPHRAHAAGVLRELR